MILYKKNESRADQPETRDAFHWQAYQGVSKELIYNGICCRTKKLFKWEFQARFVNDDEKHASASPSSKEKGLPYGGCYLLFKIEMKDSTQSGKKTISMNGTEIISQTKM